MGGAWIASIERASLFTENGKVGESKAAARMLSVQLDLRSASQAAQTFLLRRRGPEFREFSRRGLYKQHNAFLIGVFD